MEAPTDARGAGAEPQARGGPGAASDADAAHRAAPHRQADITRFLVPSAPPQPQQQHDDSGDGAYVRALLEAAAPPPQRVPDHATVSASLR